MGSPLLNILFSGMIAADPNQGGATWAVLQYVLGLRELGHNVAFIESIPAKSIRPAGAVLAQSINAAYFREVVADFGLDAHAGMLLEGTRQTVGLPYDELHAIAGRADVLINVSGMLADSELICRAPIRIYLDLDPAFIQLWQAVEGIDMHLEGHTHFVTVGLEIGAPSNNVPTCGRDWIGTLQPIVLSHWPRASEIHHDALTTVGNWRGYGSIDYDGVFYGQKAHSVRQFITLPQLADEKFLLALAIHPEETADLQALKQHGWQLTDPQEAADAPARYRKFIQQSKGEFGIAKSGYVTSKCGWFSDRSVCYLASGRPVMAQETGFSRHLTTGEGLLPFTVLDDALRCVESINEDYARHSAAARRLAETYFQSEYVLTRLLRRVGALR